MIVIVYHLMHVYFLKDLEDLKSRLSARYTLQTVGTDAIRVVFRTSSGTRLPCHFQPDTPVKVRRFETVQYVVYSVTSFFVCTGPLWICFRSRKC